MQYAPTYHRPHRQRKVLIELWRNEGAGTVLFYPGTMLSPCQYRPLLCALRESGLAVAALHLTGHGRNTHWTGFSFDDLLADGLEAEAWLHREGLGPVAVCGHSQGGILTLAHAAASENLVAAFPITGVLPQMAEAMELTIFRRWAHRRAGLMERINDLARRLPRLALPLQAYLSPARILSGARRTEIAHRYGRYTYPLGFLASLFNAHLHTRLHCPLWLFSARDDALFTPAVTQATYDLLEAPRKSLVWLSGGGHLAAMNPPLCRFMARTIAAACAGLGLPLRLRRGETASGGMTYGL